MPDNNTPVTQDSLIEKAKIYQQELDKQIVAEAATGWMEGNLADVKYDGGDEVKIPYMDMDGLGDYDRAEGYPEGAVTLAYQTMRMTQDRGTSFNIDAMSADESGIDNLMGKVMSEFQRTKVIPEIDAYRLSKLYQLAAGANRVSSYTPAEATILKKLRDDIVAVQEITGEGMPLVVHISMAVAAILDNSEKLSRQLNVLDFARGEISLKVKGLDDIPLLRTPSSRMKTAYVFYTGRPDGNGDKTFGFAPQEAVTETDEQTEETTVVTPAAKQINWLIMARTTPKAVSKTDTIRLFDPMTWQKANAWHADYRKFHDLWVPRNQLETLRASVGA